MKRKAILIGYSDKDAMGNNRLNIKKDIEGYTNFLLSAKGGAWYENEIKTIINEDISELNKTIEQIRKEENDIVIVTFSGHGDYDDVENYCRRLELLNGKTILEKKLWGLAKRQILICDSCSGLRSEYANESLLEEKGIMALEDISERKKILSRNRYNELCKNTPEQLLRLYASKIGTSAIEDNGGLYTQTLIHTLNNAETEIDIVTAHDITKEIIINKTKYDDGIDGTQIPQRSVPRIHNYLPGTIII